MRSEYLPLLLGPELSADLFPSNKTEVIMMLVSDDDDDQKYRNTIMINWKLC